VKGGEGKNSNEGFTEEGARERFDQEVIDEIAEM
jgi:hypothetical protein